METITGFFSSVPLDYFIIGGIILIVAVDSLRSGIGRAAAVSVALTLAFVFHQFLASAAFLGTLPMLSSGIAAAGAVGGLVVLAYFLVRRMGLEYIDGGMGQPIQAAIASLAVTIILIVTWLGIPALTDVWQFNSQIQSLFAESYRLFWLLGAFAALAFARG
jgi:hypothetical protein